MDFRIYAVGSSSALVKEIEDALLLITGEGFEIRGIYGSEVSNNLDGSLYVCNNTQIDNIAPYISEDKIVILNLTPTSQFYVQVSSIPVGSEVHVFNNKLPYIKSLINSCKEVGINNLNFIPVPYAEISHEKTVAMLQNAKYIIGVERLLNDVLLSGEYSHVLDKNVIIIGGKRVASIKSACEIISIVNSFLYNAITSKLAKMTDSLMDSNNSQGLLKLYYRLNELDKIISKVNKDDKPNSQTLSNDNAIIQSALNQIVPYNKNRT